MSPTQHLPWTTRHTNFTQITSLEQVPTGFRYLDDDGPSNSLLLDSGREITLSLQNEGMNKVAFNEIPPAAWLLFAGGCASPTGDWSTMYWPGGPVTADKAPQTGHYKLYASANSKPIRKANLQEGDKIGFSRDAKGRLVAVAGVKCWRLDDGNYYWLLPSDDDPAGPADSIPVSEMLDDLARDVAEASVYGLFDFLEAWLEGDVGSGSDHHHHHHENDGNHEHPHPVHNPPTTQPRAQ